MKNLIQLFSLIAIISVAHADISIGGQVKKPGKYTATEDITLAKALKLAGGISVFGHSVILYRDNKEAGWIHLFGGSYKSSRGAQAFTVKDGDMIHVTGKPLTKIEIPEHISNIIESRNKVCYKVDYSLYYKKK